MTRYDIRQATPDDTTELAALSHESFGYPVSADPHPDPHGAGRTTWVATADGRVVASLVHRRYRSWWWGEQLETAGIAGVKVAAEHRGKGLMGRLFDTAFAAARQEGALVSTLFPTAPAIYRSLGYEVVTSYDDETVVPTTAFGGIEPGLAQLRRAAPKDLPAIRDAYDEWARQHNGPLVRRGPSFPDGADAMTGVAITLAERDGEVRGVLVWDRDKNYGTPESVLEVHDFVALDADAARTLLASVASHATVSPTTVWCTSGLDVAHLITPQWQWNVRRTYPYMLTVLDVPGVLRARRYPTWVDAASTFAVGDRVWRIEVANGDATVSIARDEPRIAFTDRGFALVWSGAASCATARTAGLLTGEDDFWDLLCGGRQVHIRDYF